MHNVASCGSAPTIVVIMVGRKRSRQARCIAASAETPSLAARRWIAASIIMTPFGAADGVDRVAERYARLAALITLARATANCRCEPVERKSRPKPASRRRCSSRGLATRDGMSLE
jgi:hypothetical protein